MIGKLQFRYKLKRVLAIEYPSTRSKIIALFTLLDGNKLKRLPRSIRLKSKLEVAYPNISKYTQSIKELIYTVDNQRLISSDMQNDRKYVVIFDSFFTDQNNYYVEIDSAFNEYKAQCLKLLDLLEPTDTAEYGYYEYLSRVLKNEILHIEDLLIRLVSLLT